MTKAVFLDRDGVINYDNDYVGSLSQFEFIPGAIEALAQLKSLGYLLILTTNQSGIARGKYTLSDFYQITAYMQQVLDLHEARLDGVYFCPHHPQGQVAPFNISCKCRKPQSGMYEKAIADLQIDPSQSFAIGDKHRDLLGAFACGVKRGFLIQDKPDLSLINNLAEDQSIEFCSCLAEAAIFISNSTI